MDQNSLLLLVAAAAVGLFAITLILRRYRHEDEDATRDNPFGTSTEGMKVCQKCGRQNLWTDRTCIYCSAPLRG